MASEKQIRANRENAKRSPGPTTPPGKAKSSMNALRTGLFSKKVVLPNENEKDFRRLRTALYDEWRPLGPTETSQVERLAALLWKQGRVYRTESGLHAMYSQSAEGQGGIATALIAGEQSGAFDSVQRTDGAIERSFHLTIDTLQQLQAKRHLRAGLANAPAVAAEANSSAE
jgi:hypothetical protein